MIRFIREILAGLTVLDMILAIVGDDAVSASFRVTPYLPKWRCLDIWVEYLACG